MAPRRSSTCGLAVVGAPLTDMVSMAGTGRLGGGGLRIDGVGTVRMVFLVCIRGVAVDFVGDNYWKNKRCVVVVRRVEQLCAERTRPWGRPNRGVRWEGSLEEEGSR